MSPITASLPAPLGFMPKYIADRARGYKLEDGTTLVDRLLMVKMPEEIAALRKAAKLADDGYEVPVQEAAQALAACSTS